MAQGPSGVILRPAFHGIFGPRSIVWYERHDAALTAAGDEARAATGALARPLGVPRCPADLTTVH